MKELSYFKPKEIENRSFEIITQELGRINPNLCDNAVLKRVIHTTADFDYADNLIFSDNAIESGIKALKGKAVILSDTNMTKAGINKTALNKLRCNAECFMSDADVASKAEAEGCTRAKASMDKAVSIKSPLIITIGNAPTALIRVFELIKEGRLAPCLVVGVPVGFVNVVESKELFLNENPGVPYIIARGRKGGSTVSAAIINALMYEALKI